MFYVFSNAMAHLGPGARNKPRILQDVCADCGSTGWFGLLGLRLRFRVKVVVGARGFEGWGICASFPRVFFFLN